MTLHTPEGRCVWEAVFKPTRYDANDPNSKNEFSIAVVFPRTADMSGLTNAAMALLTDKFGADQSKWPQPLKTPFRKARERYKFEDGKQIIPKGYEDPEAIFMTFKRGSENPPPPGVFDEMATRIMDSSKFYSGCHVIVDTNPFWYEVKGNRGISFGLNHVQKIKDDERLGGGMPEASFKPVAGTPAAGMTPGGVITPGAASNVFGV